MNEQVLEELESKLIAQKLQLKKILKPYDKDLQLYLRYAEYPTFSNSGERKRLFDAEEIDGFLNEGKMLPLEKLVILSSIMERCLLLSFTGGLTAHIPLQFTGENSDFMSQMLMNIYFVLAVMDNDFNRKGRRQKVSGGEILDGESNEQIDLSSLEAVLLAARYRGFKVSIAIQRRKVA